jgi:superfamily I DNA/RNA helicase
LLKEIIPAAQSVKLEQTYPLQPRLFWTPPITVVREQPGGRKDKRLWTETKPGDEIILHEAINEQEEAGVRRQHDLGRQRTIKA